MRHMHFCVLPMRINKYILDNFVSQHNFSSDVIAGSCVQLVHRDLNLSTKTLFMCYVGGGISNDLGPTYGKYASQALYKVYIEVVG